MPGEKKIFSVSELTGRIKQTLETGFPEIWVEGEISNLKRHSSGHMYFSLKDDDAQIACAMFRYADRNMGFLPEDGMKILARGRISVYPRRGNYQMIADEIEPRGKGSLHLAFEQLKKKLEAEGLFSPGRKKPLPLLPERIGIVTSPTGAAVRDIINVIIRRFASVHLLINPVRVQGEGAADEIVAAIRDFEEKVPVDVIILARGGGSLEDLWAFNEEKVARAVFGCKTPVISAVGHEVDFTISDFTADLRAPTPSAAAEMVTAEKEKLAGQILDYRAKLLRSFEQRISTLNEKVNYFKKGYGFRRVEDRLGEFIQQTDEMRTALEDAMSVFLREKRKNVETAASGLKALGPGEVLRRGYSITLSIPDGKVLTGPSGAPEGSRLRIVLSRGELEAEVTACGEESDEI